MSQSPEGDIFLVIKNDTFICGVFTVFKNAGKTTKELSLKYPGFDFRIKPLRIDKNLIKPLKDLIVKE